MNTPGKLVAVSSAAGESGDGGQSVRRLVSEIKSQWLHGTPADAQGVLAQHPELGSDKSVVLDLAYEEYCLRQEAGTPPDPDEFCERFPHYKTSLRRLLEAHRCLEDSPADDAQVSWPEVGDSFLGFRLRRELGRGAFARVFLANDTELGDKWVVVKVARHGAAEASLLGRLDGHPNVVPVLSVKKEDLSGWTAVCMPYLGSATLCDVIDHAFARPGPPRDGRVILEGIAQRRFPGDPVNPAGPHRLLRRGTYIDAVLHLAVQLADALAFVHAAGVCHGDLKPSNILMTPDGKPMLVDFNLAFDPRQSGQRLGGTLPYMAPEQLLSSDGGRGPTSLDARSDLFSLGVILYELLTGEHPFGPIALKHPFPEVRTRLLERQRQGARPVRRLNPHVPVRFARLVEQCLAFEPIDRPRSLDQVVLVLRKELRGPRVARRWLVRHPGFVLSVLLFLLGCVAGGYGVAAWQDYRHRLLWEHAQQSYQEQRYTEAIHDLTHVIAVDPANAHAWYLRGRAYWISAANVGQALTDLTEADRRRPSGKLKALLGYLNNVVGKTKNASDYYRQAIAAGLSTAEVYNNLGYTQQLDGELREALASFRTAIEINPELQAALYNRAFLLLRLKPDSPREVAGVLPYINTAIELGPRTGQLYRHAASLYAVAAESDRKYVGPALQLLRKAIELGEDPQQLNADAYFNSLQEEATFQELMHMPYTPGPPPANLRLVDLVKRADYFPW